MTVYYIVIYEARVQETVTVQFIIIYYEWQHPAIFTESDHCCEVWHLMLCEATFRNHVEGTMPKAMTHIFPLYVYTYVNETDSMIGYDIMMRHPQ